MNDLEIVTRGLKYPKLLFDINLDLVHILFMKNAERQNHCSTVLKDKHTHIYIYKQLTTDKQCCGR